LARYLIINGKTRFQNMKFDSGGRIIDFGVSEAQLQKTILEGTPFCTSGCPECNRPYYNERPGGPMYNYPRQPSSEEINEIMKQVSEGY